MKFLVKIHIHNLKYLQEAPLILIFFICSGCDPIPVKYLRVGWPWAHRGVVFACLGLMATFFVTSIFIIYRDTPVVKSSSRELCYIILVGICPGLPVHLLSYRQTSLHLLLPAAAGHRLIACHELLSPRHQDQSHRSDPGRQQKENLHQEASFHERLCPAGDRLPTDPPAAGHHRGALRDGASRRHPWLSLHPRGQPHLQYHQLRRGGAAGLQRPPHHELHLLRLQDAQRSRQFNEAKYIAFTMYTTCIIWLAFVPIYFGSNYKDHHHVLLRQPECHRCSMLHVCAEGLHYPGETREECPAVRSLRQRWCACMWEMENHHLRLAGRVAWSICGRDEDLQERRSGVCWVVLR